MFFLKKNYYIDTHDNLISIVPTKSPWKVSICVTKSWPSVANDGNLIGFKLIVLKAEVLFSTLSF